MNSTSEIYYTVTNSTGHFLNPRNGNYEKDFDLAKHGVKGVDKAHLNMVAYSGTAIKLVKVTCEISK